MFPTPPKDKYYFVDSGYANRRGYLSSYRKQSNTCMRFHLQEFLNVEPPKNNKEMFNRWHASFIQLSSEHSGFGIKNRRF